MPKYLSFQCERRDVAYLGRGFWTSRGLRGPIMHGRTNFQSFVEIEQWEAELLMTRQIYGRFRILAMVSRQPLLWKKRRALRNSRRITGTAVTEMVNNLTRLYAIASLIGFNHRRLESAAKQMSNGRCCPCEPPVHRVQMHIPTLNLWKYESQVPHI